MDASKTGLRVKQPVFKEDKQQWGTKQSWYAWKLEQAKGGKNDNKKSLLKRQGLPFILDVLVEEGETLRKKALEDYRKLKSQSVEEDQDLSRPWNAAKAKAVQAKTRGISGLAENLDDIEAHVHEAQEEYLRAVVISRGASSEGPSSKDRPYTKAASFFAKPPCFRGFVFFSDEDVQTLKASLASTKSLTFAFSVAFHDLCAIKARATGNVAITHQFAQCVTVPSVVVRTFSQTRGADA